MVKIKVFGCDVILLDNQATVRFSFAPLIRTLLYWAV